MVQVPELLLLLRFDAAAWVRLVVLTSCSCQRVPGSVSVRRGPRWPSRITTHALQVPGAIMVFEETGKRARYRKRGTRFVTYMRWIEEQYGLSVLMGDLFVKVWDAVSVHFGLRATVLRPANPPPRPPAGWLGTGPVKGRGGVRRVRPSIQNNPPPYSPPRTPPPYTPPPPSPDLPPLP